MDELFWSIALFIGLAVVSRNKLKDLGGKDTDTIDLLDILGSKPEKLKIDNQETEDLKPEDVVYLNGVPIDSKGNPIRGMKKRY